MGSKLRRPAAAKQMKLAGAHIRCDQHKPPARLQRSGKAGKGSQRIGKVLDDVVHDHKIKGAVRKTAVCEGAIVELDVRVLLARARDSGTGEVEPDDGRPAGRLQLRAQPTLAAPDVRD